MRIELRQNLRHSLLNKVYHIDGVHILVVDDIQQVVQLVTA